MMLYFLSRKWKSNFIPKTFPFDSVNWEASVESKEFSFFSVLPNQFFSFGVVFHFTSDSTFLLFSLPLFNRKLVFLILCFRFFDFKKFIFIDFSLLASLVVFVVGNFSFFFWFVSLVASKFCKRPSRVRKWKTLLSVLLSGHVRYFLSHNTAHILSLRYHTDARLIHFVARLASRSHFQFRRRQHFSRKLLFRFLRDETSCVHFVSLRHNPGGGILCVRRDFIRSHPLSSHTFTDKIMIFWSFHEIFTSAARKFLYFLFAPKIFSVFNARKRERERKKNNPT